MLMSVGFVMTLTVMLSLGWTIFSSYKQDLNNLKNHGELLAKMQASTLAGPIWDMNKNQADLLLHSLQSDEAFLNAKIYDTDGKLFSEINDRESIEQKDTLTFSSKIPRENEGEIEILGELEIILSKKILYKRLMENFLSDIYLFVILLGATLSTLYFVLNRLIIKPLTAMYTTIIKMKANDYGIKLPVYGDNEFGILAQAFNRRAEKLDEYYEKIQERKEQLEAANENLKQARQEAIKANKSKSQFLANMSHELRTPLNAIIGYSEILIDEAPELEGPDFVPELLKILSSGKHLLEIINDILDISKIEAGKMELHIEDFKIQPLINEISHLVVPLVEKNSNVFKARIENRVKNMNSDSTKIRQNLLNLISNATKFTERGRVNLEVKKEGDYILFQVKDTGIGMTPDQLSKIFKSFTQADSSTTKKYGGTGLGLTITKEFCRMLGGEIWVESEIGRGTSFFMKLPVQAPVTSTGKSSAA